MKNAILIIIVLVVLIGLATLLYFNPLGFGVSPVDIKARILHYEDIRYVPQELKDFLTHDDPEIRQYAATAIGRIGNADAYDLLFPMLNDTVPEVASAAAFAIGLSDNAEYARVLLRNCDIYEPDLRADVVEAAGYLIDSTISDTHARLIELLADTDHRVREQAAMALLRARARESIPELIKVCRYDPVRSVQVAALYALVRSRADNDLGLYADWLPDSDPFVRALAIRGLAVSKDSSQLRFIAGGLNDRDNNVVAQAVYSLARINTRPAIGYLYDRFRNESDEKLKVLQLETFSRMESNIAEDMAYTAVHEDSSYNVKAAAIEYLLKMRGKDMLSLVDSLLDDNNQHLKLTIIQALAGVKEETVELRLKELAGDSSEIVRAFAFESLCAVDSSSRAKIEYNINEAMKDSSHIVVGTAVDYIGQNRLAKFLPQLKTIMKMEELAHMDLRRSVVGAVASMLADDSTNKMAEEILFMGLHDKDYIVSRAASDAYTEYLGIDKSNYIAGPKEMASVGKLKSFLKKYKTNPRAIIHTTAGDIIVELYADVAPLAVYNFIKLSAREFYRDIIFHRVIPNFVVQGGCPYGIGLGGPDYTIRGEASNVPYLRGAVGMADSGMDTGGSQFFITLAPQPHLEGRYTLFGQVISGMNVVDQIVRGDSIKHISIRKGDKK